MRLIIGSEFLWREHFIEIERQMSGGSGGDASGGGSRCGGRDKIA
jgi:hypothetical protein